MRASRWTKSRGFPPIKTLLCEKKRSSCLEVRPRGRGSFATMDKGVERRKKNDFPGCRSVHPKGGKMGAGKREEKKKNYEVGRKSAHSEHILEGKKESPSLSSA